MNNPIEDNEPRHNYFHYEFSNKYIEYTFTDNDPTCSYLNTFVHAYNISCNKSGYNWSEIDGNELIPLLFDGNKFPIYMSLFALAAIANNVECVKAMKTQIGLFDYEQNLYCHVQMMFASGYGLQGCITLDTVDLTLLKKLYWYHDGTQDNLTVKCINLYNRRINGKGKDRHFRRLIRNECAVMLRA